MPVRILVEGEGRGTPGPTRGDDADTVRGEGWIARRTATGFALDYDAGGIQAQDVSITITAEEFARLRADHAQFMPIVYAHGG